MTATTITPETKDEVVGVGRVVRVIGPVVDVDFPAGQLPKILNALRLTNPSISDQADNLVLEVGDGAGTVEDLVAGTQRGLLLTCLWYIREVDPQTMLLTGTVFVVVGIAFKFGAAPFHMWVPDVYQGAPTGVTLLLGGAPKLATFAIVVRLLVEGLLPLLGRKPVRDHRSHRVGQHR